MAVPVFVQAGSGFTFTTGTANSVSLAGCKAGNLLIVHGYVDGTTNDYSIGGHSNIARLDGVANDATFIANFGVGSVNVGFQFFEVGRAMADGTCSLLVDVGASGEDLFLRIYEFTGASANTTATTNVIESVPDPYAFTKGTSTTVSSTAVVTSGADRLGVQLVAINASQALGDFTSETGTDWTETVAEYTGGGSLATLQLQTGSIPSAATAGGGGTITITSAEWCSIGTAIIPATALSVPAEFPARHFGPF